MWKQEQEGQKLRNSPQLTDAVHERAGPCCPRCHRGHVLPDPGSFILAPFQLNTGLLSRVHCRETRMLICRRSRYTANLSVRFLNKPVTSRYLNFPLHDTYALDLMRAVTAPLNKGEEDQSKQTRSTDDSKVWGN